MSKTSFPVDNLLFNMTGRFGPRKRIKLPGGGYSGSFHYGDDLAPETKGKTELVYAIFDGKVHSVGRKVDAGIYIIIENSEGTRARYAHLSTYGVRAGDSVYAGQPIGRVGSTGNSTGVHLHIEIYLNWQLDKRVDPMPYYWYGFNPAKKKASKPTPSKPKPTPPSTKRPYINGKVKLSTPWHAYRYNTLVGEQSQLLPAGTYTIKGIVNGNLRLHGNGRQAWVHSSAAAGLVR